MTLRSGELVILAFALGALLSLPNPTVLADGTRTYLPGAPGAGYAEAGVWYSGLLDQHGSLLGTVSEAGVLSPLRTYDPYGAPRPGSTDPAGIGFTGEWRNATGLVNLRFRSYDPVLGRFIGRDTFGGLAAAPQTANRYTFGAANPLTATDPSGHFNNHLIMPVRAFVALGVAFAGPVGLGYVTLSGILGYDPIAGVTLTPEERLLYLAPAGIGLIAKIAPKVASLAPRLVTALAGRAEGALAFVRATLREGLGFIRSLPGRLGETAGSFWRATLEGRPLVGSQAGHIRIGGRSGATGLSELANSAIETVESGRAYSVAFETRLRASSYPGVSRGAHFQEANENLLAAMDADPALADAIETLIPGLRQQLTGARSVSRSPPAGWTWHHAQRPGVMQLVPRIQHTAPGRLQELFHLGGEGGWAIWGRS